MENNVIDSFSGEYEFLSNFYVREMTFRGLKCTSSESAFQAMKTTNLEQRKEIAAALPSRSKRLGRKVQLRNDWDYIKTNVMYEIVLAKFTQHPDLKQKLLDTGDAKLVEGNTWGDQFWGVCDGVGQNELGKILMWVRFELS